jgi:hypothetical protein
VEKARFLRDRGGMALIITHPDYASNPHLVSSYCRFLQEFAADSSAWKALPRDVSSWWRRRSKSSLKEVDGEWRVVGPARDEAESNLPQLSSRESDSDLADSSRPFSALPTSSRLRAGRPPRR